jgi:intracellular sulfur oxidation DsrE/DsrF family protein
MASAGPEMFVKGPVITASGAVANVKSDLPLPANKDWKMVFNVPTAVAGKLNPRIDAAARFINMLAASGVPMSRIHVALVAHSEGLMDFLTAKRYGDESGGAANPNEAVIRQLIGKGVPVYICGQSAELSDVTKADLVPGVKLALSAMTTYADLQGQGYAVNP